MHLPKFSNEAFFKAVKVASATLCSLIKRANHNS